MTTDLPAALRNTLNQLREVRSRLASEHYDQIITEGQLSCRKGCNNCCRYPLYVSYLEGVLIYRQMRKARLWSARIKERLQEASASSWGLSLEVWLLSNRPCALLQDGTCLIYDQRPFLCRTVASRGDPHSCHPHRFLEANLVPREEILQRYVEVEKRLLWRYRIKRVVLPLATSILAGEVIGTGEHDIRSYHRAIEKVYP